MCLITVSNCYQSAKATVLFHFTLKAGMVEGLNHSYVVELKVLMKIKTFKLSEILCY